MPTRQDARRWSARLTRSIELRDGTELDTLADAANFILALPEHYQDRNSWKRATELLMQAAEQDGDIEGRDRAARAGAVPRGEVCEAVISQTVKGRRT